MKSIFRTWWSRASLRNPEQGKRMSCFTADDQNIGTIHLDLIRLDVLGWYNILWPKSDLTNTDIFLWSIKWRRLAVSSPYKYYVLLTQVILCTIPTTENSDITSRLRVTRDWRKRSKGKKDFLCHENRVCIWGDEKCLRGW